MAKFIKSKKESKTKKGIFGKIKEFIKDKFFSKKTQAQQLIEPKNENIETAPKKKVIKYILSLDGGGVRAFIQVALLKKIESELKKENMTIFDKFDIFAGTSSGAIVALMLSLKQAKESKDINNFFISNLPNIFTEQKQSFFSKVLDNKYSDNSRELIIKKLFDKKTVSDSVKDVVITSYDTKSLEPICFTKEKFPKAEIKDVLMASTALPIFFSPFQYEYENKKYNLIDGAIFANNPSLYSYIYCKEKYKDVDEIRILSLASYQNPSDFSLVKNKKDWTDITKSGSSALTKIYSIAQQNTIDDILNNIEGVKYLRIKNKKGEFNDSYQVDSKNISDIENLKKIGEKIADSEEENIKNFLFDHN